MTNTCMILNLKHVLTSHTRIRGCDKDVQLKASPWLIDYGTAATSHMKGEIERNHYLHLHIKILT